VITLWPHPSTPDDATEALWARFEHEGMSWSEFVWQCWRERVAYRAVAAGYVRTDNPLACVASNLAAFDRVYAVPGMPLESLRAAIEFMRLSE
jgi:hypothetical protein